MKRPNRWRRWVVRSVVRRPRVFVAAAALGAFVILSTAHRFDLAPDLSGGDQFALTSLSIGIGLFGVVAIETALKSRTLRRRLSRLSAARRGVWLLAALASTFAIAALRWDSGGKLLLPLLSGLTWVGWSIGPGPGRLRFALAMLVAGLGLAERWDRHRERSRRGEAIEASAQPILGALQRSYDLSGRWPDSLSELVPEYLDSVPDPGTELGGPFEYSTSSSDGRFRLGASVGSEWTILATRRRLERVFESGEPGPRAIAGGEWREWMVLE